VSSIPKDLDRLRGLIALKTSESETRAKDKNSVNVLNSSTVSCATIYCRATGSYHII
jgi:hypothetical protein